MSPVQEWTERCIVIFEKNFQSLFSIIIIWVQFRDGNMQQSGSFRLFSFGVINMLRHRKHMLHPTEHLRKHAEKWSGSAVSAATETWVNVMILSTGTRVSRYVSAIKTKVSATFP